MRKLNEVHSSQFNWPSRTRVAIAREAKRRTIDNLHLPVRITQTVLFGSTAQNRATRISDVDFAVVLEGNPSDEMRRSCRQQVSGQLEHDKFLVLPFKGTGLNPSKRIHLVVTTEARLGLEPPASELLKQIKETGIIL